TCPTPICPNDSQLRDIDPLKEQPSTTRKTASCGSRHVGQPKRRRQRTTPANSRGKMLKGAAGIRTRTLVASEPAPPRHVSSRAGRLRPGALRHQLALPRPSKPNRVSVYVTWH